MKFNCKTLIITGFNLQGTICNHYYETIINQLNNHYHQLDIKLVASQSFISEVLLHKQNLGICLSKSGVQECCKLNQFCNIRAALVHTQYIAEMCRKHNDANVCIIGTDCIGAKLAGSLVLYYVATAFDNQQRNMLRIQKMRQFEQKFKA